jgi:hypothetical protein
MRLAAHALPRVFLGVALFLEWAAAIVLPALS